MVQEHIVPLLDPELMSTPTYDPFGTETTCKSKLFLCQIGHKEKLTYPVMALRGQYGPGPYVEAKMPSVYGLMVATLAFEVKHVLHQRHLQVHA